MSKVNRYKFTPLDVGTDDLARYVAAPDNGGANGGYYNVAANSTLDIHVNFTGEIPVNRALLITSMPFIDEGSQEPLRLLNGPCILTYNNSEVYLRLYNSSNTDFLLLQNDTQIAKVLFLTLDSTVR